MTRRLIEYVPFLDASKLAWGGVLDNAADQEWVWEEHETAWDDSYGLQHAVEALRVISAEASAVEPPKAFLRLEFEVVGTWWPSWSRPHWDQTFEFEGVPQPFGGARWWFLCHGCEARRARLYRHDLRPWMCRVCLDLDYTSHQRYGPSSRWGEGQSALWRQCDLEERFCDGLDRRNMRRRLSRWRREARQDERREEWPVQVTGRAGVDLPSSCPARR